MPSPTLFEWCTSIHKTVHDLINNYTKTDVETSPTISAIQSLRGKATGEKLKDLNLLIRKVKETIEQHGEMAATEFHDVPQVMGDFVRVCIAIKMRSEDAIIEALRSKDQRIVKKALSAHWFFDGANSSVDVGNFVSNIIPLVSLRTRLDIIKKLGRSLNGHEKKAEEFFNVFVELYGLEVCLPILVDCSETFIYNAVLKHKIHMPIKLLRVLHKKYPNFVVKYLHLGNKTNARNVEDRKVHEIFIHDYDTFLPALIKDHPRDFIELYKLTPEKSLKLSNTLAATFLKNSTDEIVKNPQIFLKLLSLNVVRKNLPKEKFKMMFENLFPADLQDFNVSEMLEYIQHYPQEEKLQMLKDTYRKLYKKNILDNQSCTKSPDFLRILSIFERERAVEALLAKCEKKSDLSNEYLGYLPPSRTLSIFKVKIEHAHVADERALLFSRLIASCGMCKSDEGLFQVIKFYHDMHKNEQNLVLCSFLQDLKKEFDINSLSVKHWTLLKKIIDHAYLKNELFKSHFSLIESILEGALRSGLMQQKNNQAYIDSTIDMLVECKVEQTARNFNVIRDHPELERECVDKFFQLVPIKYPETHAFWKDKNNRISLALSVLRTMHNLNTSLKQNSKTKDIQPLMMNDYAWIQKLTIEFFPRSDSSNRKLILMKMIKKISPEFYEATMEDLAVIRSIESGDAAALLRRNPRKILANWQNYLNEARELLHHGATKKSKKSARRFISLTKWHHEIPVKFIDKCLEELKEDGSIHVLGILLEGEVFEKIISPFVPLEGTVNPKKKGAKEDFDMMRSIVKAMRCTNPPVSLTLLATFCQGDYATLTEGTLASIASRIPLDEVMEFANKTLIDRPGMVMKQRIRLIQKVTTNRRLWRKFLMDTWRSKKSNGSVRHMVAKMMFDLFVKKPDDDSWELIKNCIDGLTVEDKDAIVELSEIEKVNKEYLSSYIIKYLDKIEELFKADFDFSLRTKCVCLIIESINAKSMEWITDEVSKMILDRYFFDTDSLDISRAARNFAVRSYLLTAGDKFEKRLVVVMEVLRQVIGKFDEPHPKERRFYAANFTVHEFFRDLLIELSCCNNEHKLDIVDSMLKVFTSILSPWQESSSYISFSLYREYLLAKSAEDFGTRCAKRIPGLIQDIGSDTIINYVAETLDEFIHNKIFRDARYPKLKLSVVQGLIRGDGHYGAWISAELLNYSEIKNYDECYDGIVTALKQFKNKCVQNSLYNHLNRIQLYSDDDIDQM